MFRHISESLDEIMKQQEELQKPKKDETKSIRG